MKFGKSEAPINLDEGPQEIKLEGPILLDLEAVRDEPVSEGWKTVRIERVDPGFTNKKNLPQLFVMSRIVDEADIDFDRTVIWNSILEGKGLQFTKRFFKALGMPMKLEYPSAAALADDLLERVVDVKIKHRVYEGEVRANVNQWRASTPDLAL